MWQLLREYEYGSLKHEVTLIYKEADYVVLQLTMEFLCKTYGRRSKGFRLVSDLPEIETFSREANIDDVSLFIHLGEGRLTITIYGGKSLNYANELLTLLNNNLL